MAEAVFPRNPFHGQTFTLPGSGRQYVYDKTRYSWLSTPVTGTAGGGDGGSVSISMLLHIRQRTEIYGFRLLLTSCMHLMLRHL